MLLDRPPAIRPIPAHYLPLTPREPGPVAAVDGSRAILVDNGSVWVAATRATVVAWPGPPQAEAAPRIHATAAVQAQERLDSAYARHGLEAPAPRSADAWADALCSLEEFESTLQATEQVPSGSLMLVDGSLAGLPRHAQMLADRLLEAAKRRGVCLVGVAKRSGLDRDGIALVPHLLRNGPAQPWAVQVQEEVHIARLHRAAAHAFRVDGPLEGIERLLPLCRDVVYAGYPYPLAVAHNRVALTASHVRDLKSRLAGQARRAGGAQAMALLADFHDTLDRNVPG
jgi:hypothetical protein